MDPDPKQFRALGGQPLLAWSLDLLRAAGCFPLMVVIPDIFVDRAKLEFAAPDVVVVPGGPTRQASVLEGLKRVQSSRVVVHDGARPFAPPHLVISTLAALAECDGALAALPLDETLKMVADGLVSDTPSRDGLWRAQTPQAFHTNVLHDAHDRARAERWEATDDAALVEHYGGQVRVVEGSRQNMKVTYSADFDVAEAMLRGGLDLAHP